MITLEIKENRKSPIYIQIYEYIKKEILSSKIKAGEKLPSKRILSTHLGISVNTCTLAYEKLMEEGYITSRERAGYYVEDIRWLIGGTNNNDDRCCSSKKSETEHLIDEYAPSIDLDSKSNAQNTVTERKIKFDFSYNVVDEEKFPYGIFKKLSKEVFLSENKDLLSIDDKRGILKLRESIAFYLKSNRGFSCSPENVIISSGTEYLFHVLFGVLGEDSIFAIENPGYEKWSMMFESNRVKYRLIPVDKNGMEIDKLDNSKANIACVTPSNQFPTGNVMPVTERFKLLAWADKKIERYVVEDDYDSEFKYIGKPIPSLKSLDRLDKVIYIGNFSKSIAPSFRVSYMVLPDVLLKKYIETPHMICPVSNFWQSLLALFISEGYFEKHLNRSRNLYRKKRQKIEKIILEQMPECDMPPSQFGLHFVLNTPFRQEIEMEIVETARKQGVKIAHVSEYFQENGEQERPKGIMIGFAGVKMENIEEGIKLLAGIMREH